MLGMGKTRPANLTIRAYQVGFGDCFLLSFSYPKAQKKSDQERHVLIDYGSTGMPAGIDSSTQMMSVANDIKERCNGKLTMVVATHRHKDHISGFTTKKDGSGTGDIIKTLKPDMVVQPWTEDPSIKDPKPTKKLRGSKVLPVTNAQYLSTLADMNSFAGTMRTEMAHLRWTRSLKGMFVDLVDEINFLSEDNSLPNRMAVANLASMGENHYVNFGYKLDVGRTLPGVKIHVLGPPTLEQHSEIQKQKSRDENEFWMLQGAARSFWKMQAASSELIAESAKTAESANRLFPDADVYEGYFPSNNRWFIRRLRELRTEQLLGLVRMLDKSMNNTSVILLFEVGGKKLLFPGDAQIENWEFALGKKEVQDLLKDVTVYKVGHHGSRNATPKTLWKRFGRKDKDGSAAGRLMTLNSTMKGKHGHSKNNSEVPRTTLVKELNDFSDYKSTEEAAKKKELFLEIPINL